MIHKYKGGGLLYDVSPTVLYEALLKDFVGINCKARIFGYDFDYAKDDFELYISTSDEKEYFIHIDYKGTELDLKGLLNKLKEIFKELSSNFELIYYRVDENGNALSEDVYI